MDLTIDDLEQLAEELLFEKTASASSQKAKRARRHEEHYRASKTGIVDVKPKVVHDRIAEAAKAHAAEPKPLIEVASAHRSGRSASTPDVKGIGGAERMRELAAKARAERVAENARIGSSAKPGAASKPAASAAKSATHGRIGEFAKKHWKKGAIGAGVGLAAYGAHKAYKHHQKEKRASAIETLALTRAREILAASGIDDDLEKQAKKNDEDISPGFIATQHGIHKAMRSGNKGLGQFVADSELVGSRLKKGVGHGLLGGLGGAAVGHLVGGSGGAGALLGGALGYGHGLYSADKEYLGKRGIKMKHLGLSADFDRKAAKKYLAEDDR
jgi:hypothetical protein